MLDLVSATSYVNMMAGKTVMSGQLEPDNRDVKAGEKFATIG
jgi:hypothetical protein